MPHEETGKFIADGNTRPGGKLPLNTNGGGLSYMHSGMYGMYALQESVRQMRGIAPAQVKDAKISVCHGVGGMFAASVARSSLRTRSNHLVIPGCAVRRRPGIHCAAKWIPGSRCCAPRNDGEIEQIAENPNDKITARQGHHRHRRRPRHRARDRAALRRRRRQGRGQRSRRRRRRRRLERCAGRGSGRGDQEARRHRGRQLRVGGGSDPREQDREDRDRSFRPARRRRQQCRHSARHDLPQDERGSVRGRHQGAPDGLVLRLVTPRRGYSANRRAAPSCTSPRPRA